MEIGLLVLIGTVCWLATIGLVLWTIVRIISNRRGDSPLDIARQRLARGDITMEQFAEIEKTVR
jgi:uncharacterized membrane protein